MAPGSIGEAGACLLSGHLYQHSLDGLDPDDAVLLAYILRDHSFSESEDCATVTCCPFWEENHWS